MSTSDLPATVRLHRAPATCERSLFQTSKLYTEIADGTFPPPVVLGKNSVAWPEHEIDSILRAKVAGATTEQLRTLVKRLVRDRQKFADVLEPEASPSHAAAPAKRRRKQAAPAPA